MRISDYAWKHIVVSLIKEMICCKLKGTVTQTV